MKGHEELRSYCSEQFEKTQYGNSGEAINLMGKDWLCELPRTNQKLKKC